MGDVCMCGHIQAVHRKTMVRGGRAEERCNSVRTAGRDWPKPCDCRGFTALQAISVTQEDGKE